jgi:hypothetical protein
LILIPIAWHEIKDDCETWLASTTNARKLTDMNTKTRIIAGLIISFICLGAFVFGLTTERGKGSSILGALIWVTLICILFQFANLQKKRE